MSRFSNLANALPELGREAAQQAAQKALEQAPGNPRGAVPSASVGERIEAMKRGIDQGVIPMFPPAILPNGQTINSGNPIAFGGKPLNPLAPTPPVAPDPLVGAGAKRPRFDSAPPEVPPIKRPKHGAAADPAQKELNKIQNPEGKDKSVQDAYAKQQAKDDEWEARKLRAILIRTGKAQSFKEELEEIGIWSVISNPKRIQAMDLEELRNTKEIVDFGMGTTIDTNWLKYPIKLAANMIEAGSLAMNAKYGDVVPRLDYFDSAVMQSKEVEKAAQQFAIENMWLSQQTGLFKLATAMFKEASTHAETVKKTQQAQLAQAKVSQVVADRYKDL